MEAIIQGIALPTEGTAGLGRRPAGTLFGCSYVVPYCVPFWTRATYTALLKCVVMRRIIEGPDVGRLARRLAELLGIPACVPCGSGRAGIELALRAGQVGEGADVVVPTFCCTSIIPPILAVGARPVFADVGDELNVTPETVDAAVTHRTRAVIVPHLFGNPADIDTIVELCTPRGILVIDDAAQALGAALKGRKVGTFGDAGIVSFGNGKICFGTGGGGLLSKDVELLERARQIPLGQSTKRAVVGHALSVLVWRRWRRWSLPLARVLARAKSSTGRQRAAARRAMANLDAAVAITLLDTLPENLCARRERVTRYQQRLRGIANVTLIPHRAGSACLTQVVSVDPVRGTARQLIRSLREEGFEVGESYTPLHLLAPYRAWARRRLETAERLWEGLLELPCEPSVALADADRISALLEAAVT